MATNKRRAARWLEEWQVGTMVNFRVRALAYGNQEAAAKYLEWLGEYNQRLGEFPQSAERVYLEACIYTLLDDAEIAARAIRAMLDLIQKLPDDPE